MLLYRQSNKMMLHQCSISSVAKTFCCINAQFPLLPKRSAASMLNFPCCQNVLLHQCSISSVAKTFCCINAQFPLLPKRSAASMFNYPCFTSSIIHVASTFNFSWCHKVIMPLMHQRSIDPTRIVFNCPCYCNLHKLIIGWKKHFT